ncbi:TonB-dependent receptor [Mucilaginibacter hurinus]|uniref:TonB-dependent receptor n=1 Tax=Mucilaginibacter hurinus TaxID=2201324 RepID=A0A367GSL3_9SPHI|nr:TonB-dependent receptor [Mucilaginibacter hurinus]RCH55703.1 TonB-dependent receptor [Mucilaginibacter hurinus]
MQLKLKLCLGMILLICVINNAYSQTLSLNGKVTNKEGEPLPGASVAVKGANTGTMTNADGMYTITIPQTSATLVVSFIGMSTVEKAVSQSGEVNFVLEDNNALSEVVVIGYGTQKITKVSGAISTVKGSDIERLRPVRTEEAIQGRAAGVTVVQNGSPGSKPVVLVRGIPSFGGAEPLVIIDGVMQGIVDLNALNPLDIASIDILKDAATIAIYGVKGGNGVVVVTTKTGRRNQKTDINLSSNYGVQQIIRNIPVLNATEYAAMVNEGSTLSGGNVIFPDLSTVGIGTNWQDQIFKNAPLQTHNITATGGSDKMAYFLSAGYMGQGGIVGGMDKSRFDRGNFTANLDFQLAKNLKFIVNATDVILHSKGVQENSFNSVIGNALNFDPTVSVLNEDPAAPGKYGYSTRILSEIFNPLTRLDNTYNKNTGNKLYGKFELQYDVLKDLKLSSRFGYTKYDATSKTFTPLAFYGPFNVDNTMGVDGKALPDRHNNVAHEKVSNFNYVWETFANYNFKVNEDHTFETVLGFSLAKQTGNVAGATRQDVPFNSWEFADFTAATGINNEDNLNARDGYYSQYFRKNMSFFGRVNYDYKSRYLASFSARRDGSYVFGSNNKFANFYAGSLGWVVSEESFFKVPFINFFKIRGSYGTSGNDSNLGPTYTQVGTGGPDYGSPVNSNGYNFDNVFLSGSTIARLSNPSLRWEKLIQSNIGFDITVFENKISLSADYFRKDVSGLLFVPSASLYLGTVPIPVDNVGSTKTSGFDFTLSYNERIGRDFKLGNTFTFTTSKNTVTQTNDDGTARIVGGSYFNGQSQTVTVFEKGYTPWYFYGYKTNGLFQNAAEVAAAPTQTGAQPGDIRFVDINGDGVITAADQTQIGNPYPKFTMGWNLTMNYKNFDFNAFTYISVGNDIYRAYERNQNYTNKDRSVLGRWTGEGSTNDAKRPRYSFTDANSNIRVSDRYVEDGSFVKVKNIQLGYTFPVSITKVFKSVRLYGQVRNAFVFTKYTGFDPEIQNGSAIGETGIDRGTYPQPRVYSVGLDIKL